MQDVKVVGFEKGIEYIVQTILKIKEQEKPVLVSVHGVHNSGKTEFMIKVRDELYNKHSSLGWIGMRDDSLDRFIVSDKPDYFLIEDACLPCSANRYAKEHFGRPTHFSVYVTKNLTSNPPPKLKSESETNFDLIIENPNAKIVN